MPFNLLDADSETEFAKREGLWTLNFGPQHPATHTTLRLVLELDGEMVIKATPDIGYLHSGFEKLGEVLDFNQYVTIVDRMNYISPLANEIGWHHACEKLLGIELTPRCSYLRTILAELMRIHDHLLCVGACILDLGGVTPMFYCLNEREKIFDICERASGQRFHTSFTRVGGLLYDVSDDWLARVKDFTQTFPSTLKDLNRMVMKNRIFIERTQGVGILTRADAVHVLGRGWIVQLFDDWILARTTRGGEGCHESLSHQSIGRHWFFIRNIAALDRRRPGLR